MDEICHARVKEPIMRGLPENARVLRGGSFYDITGGVRCAYRLRYDPDARDSRYGFRVVASPIQFDQLSQPG